MGNLLNLENFHERHQLLLCKIGLHTYDYKGCCTCGSHTYPQSNGILEQYAIKARYKAIKKAEKKKARLILKGVGVQSKQKSMLESFANTTIGLLSSFLIQLLLYPVLGIPVTLNQNIIITIVFFAVSFSRSYLLRRYFNKN